MNLELHGPHNELPVFILPRGEPHRHMSEQMVYQLQDENQEDSLSFQVDAYSDLKDTLDKNTFSQVPNFFLTKIEYLLDFRRLKD